MKLRIRENSIRLRLRQPEVVSIVRDGRLESITDFGNATFRFSLVGKEGALLSASFADNALVVTAPLDALSAWAASDEVGLYSEQPTSTSDLLTIAIEKDFRCLDRNHADDDQAGAYPHPAKNAART